MMARFNNFNELKQVSKITYHTLNTPLFEQYQNVDKVLSQDNEISQLFSKKSKIY